jgi:hypothetical protein
MAKDRYFADHHPDLDDVRLRRFSLSIHRTIKLAS